MKKGNKGNKELYYIGRYSNSQNANVYGIDGLSPCLCSGGSGHDATIPKILLYDLEEIFEEDRHSYNFTVAVFDTDKNILYIYEISHNIL